jgi:hypothetical protein
VASSPPFYPAREQRIVHLWGGCKCIEHEEGDYWVGWSQPNITEGRKTINRAGGDGCIFIYSNPYHKTMKKFTATIFTLLACTILTSGQNLVPNYSFELYDTCPSVSSQIHFAPPWYGVENSTDYFNACATSPEPSVPNQYGGFQYARTGVAYAGFWFHNSFWREYLQVQLLQPLEVEKCYYVEFFVSLQNSMNWGINNIAAHLSDQAIFPVNPGNFLNLEPHIMITDNPIITDTLNWVQIAGYYTATGGENFLTIGNFFSLANTDTAFVQTNGYSGAYYYVDDVSVIECDVSPGINEITNKLTIAVHPNPFSSVTTLHTDKALEEATLILYNSLGQQINQIKNINGQTVSIHCENVPNGLYYMQLTQDNKTVATHKLVITDN